jgi:hypothetical protein
MNENIKYRFLSFVWRLVHFGTNANNSGKAGSFALNVNNTWSNDNANITSQLCLLQDFLKSKNLASWQNTKQCLIRFGRLILEKSEVK